MRVFMNRVIVSGYLTRDPTLQRLESGTSVCRIRIGCHTRRRDRTSGRWRQKPNFFDVTVFEDQGEAVVRHLVKGASVAVDGRLDWREWESRDGRRLQSVSIIAETVHLMDHGSAGAADRPAGGDPGQAGRRRAESVPEPAEDWLGLSAKPEAPGGDELDLDLFAAESSERTPNPDGASDGDQR